MMRRLSLLLLVACLSSFPFPSMATVPGTTSTISGYDTELGVDAVCWTGRSASLLQDNVSDTTVTPFPNPVVENFQLLGETELLQECPTGIQLKAFAPPEFGTPPLYEDGIRPRSREWYDYTMEFTIDQLGVRGNALFSDETPTIVAVQIIVCELGKVGFCSPFIHEEANFRLAEMGITTPPDKGDMHGGTHVHSPTVKVVVDAFQMVQSFNVTIPVLVNEPANFYAIGALQFYTYDQTTNAVPTAEYRYDVANALDMTLITYYDQPELLTVTTSIQILCYVLIGIACALILFLLYETIKHRNNNVIRVSQGNFLIVFLLAGLWASASAVLLQPKNDLYCNLRNPMIFVPLQLLFSITIGRLWRIQAVVSPLLIRKLKQEQNLANRFGKFIGDMSSFNAFSCWTGRSKKQHSHRNVRRTITSLQLAKVVALFTLPQVILQVVGGILDPDQVTIDFNENESVGRQICESRIDPWRNYRTYSVILLLLLFIILLAVSYASRKLPSLLNETSSISNSTIESLIALIIGFAVITITDAPTTSPDIFYLVSVLMVLTLTLNSTWRIMLPKLKMVWKGETVVISKLVSDSRERESSQMSEVMSGVTGFAPNPNAPPRVQASSVNTSGFSASFMGSSKAESENSDSALQFPYSETEVPYGHDRKSTGTDNGSEPKPERERLVSFKEDEEEDKDEGDEASVGGDVVAEGIATAAPFGELDPNDQPPPESPPTSPRIAELRAKTQSALKRVEAIGGNGRSPTPPDDTAASPPQPPPPQQQQHQELGPKHHLHHRRHPYPIQISDDETPSRRLVLRMVDLHLVLSRVNQRILSGLVVSHEDWKLLQEASVDLGHTFGDEVKFKWEQDDDII